VTADQSLHDEMQSLVRRAYCHYGNTLRDEETGRSVEHAARERDVEAGRIRELRAAAGARAATPTPADAGEPVSDAARTIGAGLLFTTAASAFMSATPPHAP
jgi:hypothetical protein